MQFVVERRHYRNMWSGNAWIDASLSPRVEKMFREMAVQLRADEADFFPKHELDLLFRGSGGNSFAASDDRK